MPSQVESEDLGIFDRFAGWVAVQVARAPFFAFCVFLIIAWAPSLPLFGNVDTWQLALNSPTTAITFLLVALLQNTTARADRASQAKQNALADGMADLLAELADELERPALARHARELREAVGLEQRVPS